MTKHPHHRCKPADWPRNRPASLHDLYFLLFSMERRIMSKFTDAQAQAQGNHDAGLAALSKINAAVQKLDDAITAFQNSPGTLSAEDQAALDNIVSLSADTRTSLEAAVGTTEDGVPGETPAQAQARIARQNGR